MGSCELLILAEVTTQKEEQYGKLKNYGKQK
jgi:hypothetical protein